MILFWHVKYFNYVSEKLNITTSIFCARDVDLSLTNRFIIVRTTNTISFLSIIVTLGDI